MFEAIKPSKRPHIGLYSIGHEHYWNQFEGLLDRLTGYGRFIEQRLSSFADVHNAGMIDTEQKGRVAAAAFNANDVDLIFCHAATYAMSGGAAPGSAPTRVLSDVARLSGV